MMENLGALKNLEELLNGLNLILDIVLNTASFLFLTIWGWIIIAVCLCFIIFVKAHNHEGEIRFSGVMRAVSETALWFFSNLTQIVIGMVLLIAVSYFSSGMKEIVSTFNLYKEVTFLQAALKNLKTERKILEITVLPDLEKPENSMLGLKYYAYSPTREEDVLTGEENIRLNAEKYYIDFGVINFEYALIEGGERKNLAFPDKIFTEDIAYRNGTDIMLTTNQVPYTFRIDEREVYLLDPEDYNAQMSRIHSAITNEALAKKMGIRTFYGEAIAFKGESGKRYTFYVTGSGGVVMK